MYFPYIFLNIIDFRERREGQSTDKIFTKKENDVEFYVV